MTQKSHKSSGGPLVNYCYHEIVKTLLRDIARHNSCHATFSFNDPPCEASFRGGLPKITAFGRTPAVDVADTAACLTSVAISATQPKKINRMRTPSSS